MTNATIKSKQINQHKRTETVRETLAIVAYAGGLSSHVSQRGRQVKFRSKKPSMHVRLIVFNGGKVPESPLDSAIVDKSIVVEDSSIASDPGEVHEDFKSSLSKADLVNKA